MNWIHISYFISILLTIAGMGYIALYSRRRRDDVPGARAYMRFAFLLGLFALFEGLSLMGPSEGQAAFWFNMRMMTMAAMPAFWLLFAFDYSGKTGVLAGRRAAALFIVPCATMVMIWTNGYHMLWVKRDVGFHKAGLFTIADMSLREPGPWFAVHIAYSYILTAIGMIVLIMTALRAARGSRGQAASLIAGTCIMIAGSVIPSFNLLPGAAVNPIIPIITLGSLVIAWGMYRHRLLGESPRIDPARTVPAALVALFVLLTAGILAAAGVYYRNFREHHREETVRQLSAVADLTVDEIVQWRAERLSDGMVLYKNDAFTDRARQMISDPGSAVIHWRVRSWIGNMQAAHRYHHIQFVDTRGNIRLSVPETAHPLSGEVRRGMEEARAKGELVFVDFHRVSPGWPINLSLVVPVIDGPRGDIVLGFVVIAIDPNNYLYPLMKRWPTPSRTAEILLVRRDGDDVLFLNELKYQQGTALSGRFPLSMKNLPAAMAVLGREGIVEGIDCRGANVVAALKQIPGTPWSLVARMDTTEIYEPVRERFWLMIVVIVGLISGTGAGIAVLWYRRDMRFSDERRASAEALCESEERFSKAFLYNPAAVVITRLSDGGVIDANESYLRLSGHSWEELTGKTGLQLNIYDNPGDRETILGLLREKGSVSDYETDLRTKSGDLRRALFSIVPIEINGENCLLSIFTDITERKRSEENLKKSEAALMKAQNVAHLGSWVWRIKENRVEWSDEMYRIFGIDKAVFTGDLAGVIATAIHPDDREAVNRANLSVARDKKSAPLEYRVVRPDGSVRWVYVEAGELVLDGKDEAVMLTGIVQDITERKQFESERETTVRLLSLLNSRRDLHDLIQEVTAFFHDEFDFEAVGIRLRDGVDFPYFETRGFPAEFVKAETSLCSRDALGKPRLDESGNPVLDCMCGNVLQGRFDPSKPFFTERGSFCSNCTTELLATTTEADRQARTRNRCNGEGYESVALVALRVGIVTYGLLQLNDRRRDRFTPESIRLIERLADNLANSIAFHVSQENLGERERHYRGLFENMLNGFAYCKMIYENGNPADFMYLEVNSAFEKLTGLADVVGKKVTAVIPGIRETDPELFAIYGRVAAMGVPENFEMKVGALDMWFSISVYSPLKEHFVAVFDVITERKRAESDLKMNYDIQRVLNELLSISLKKAPLGDILNECMGKLLSLDWLALQSKGMILLADDDQRTLSVAANHGIADPLLNAIHDKSVPFGVCLCGLAAETRKTVFMDSDDERHTVRYEGMEPHGHYCVPILHEDKVLGVLNLYTEIDHAYDKREEEFLLAAAATLAGTIIRKRAESSLEELFSNLGRMVSERTADLEKANRELESFSYTVSHDLRAPLRHISGFLEMFKREIGDLDNPRAAHYMDVIDDSARRMGQLIDDLLSFSRTGRTGLDMRAVDMGALAEEVLSTFSSEIASNKAEIIRGPLPIVTGDGAMLRVVLTNLISNAVKFSAKTAAPKIEIGCALEGSEHVCHVRDNGAGFDMRYAGKLFGVFQRLHADKEFEGTGIGLATVQKIIQRHGGTVRAEGKPGEGACFYFTLPAGRKDDSSKSGKETL